MDSIEYLFEFSIWLNELKNQKVEYLDFTLFNGLDLRGNDFIEINKGNYDTLDVTNMVSPFGYTLGQINQGFIVYQGEPVIFNGSKIRKGQVVDTYCTHNPYNKYYFGNLDQLHNNGYMVCFGIFGNNGDKDKLLKINMVKKIIQNMNDNVRFEYGNSNNNYYCVVFTKRFVKCKTLSR